MPALLRSTLLAEGNTDEALCFILTWLLVWHAQHWDVDKTRLVEAEKLDDIPKKYLAARMRRAYNLYPCEILFVHRDADSSDPKSRHAEIERAYQKVQTQISTCIAVVPVQETEAWLLFNEEAIRQAAGNPKGQAPLDLPTMKGIEKLRDPKERLYAILKKASMYHDKLPRDFNPIQRAKRIVDDRTDFAPLRALTAFRNLEQAIKAIVQEQHW